MPTILAKSLGYIGVWYISAGLVYIGIVSVDCQHAQDVYLCFRISCSCDLLLLHASS